MLRSPCAACSAAVGVAVRVKQMKLRLVGGKPQPVAALDLLVARHLGNDRFVLGQVIHIEQRDLPQSLDDRDRAFKQEVITGGDLASRHRMSALPYPLPCLQHPGRYQSSSCSTREPPLVDHLRPRTKAAKLNRKLEF